MISVTKVLDFHAGHRLLNHESKCRSAHGHSYTIEITARADKLDVVGRVIDFSVIKEVVGAWINEYWDHGFILEVGDPLQKALYEDHSKVFQLPYAPTAENIATYLLGIANQLLRPYGVTVTEIVCWETPRCYATATLDAQD